MLQIMVQNGRKKSKNNLDQEEELKESSIPEYEVQKFDKRLRNDYDIERGVEDFMKISKNSKI